MGGACWIETDLGKNKEHRPLLRRDFPEARAVAVRKYQLIK
nr:MAG TPA: hypothetical protein [Caudoviricetes sp.]